MGGNELAEWVVTKSWNTHVEGVGLVPAVARGLVLDAPTALVKPLIGEFDDVRRIGHLGGVGQGLVKDGPRDPG